MASALSSSFLGRRMTATVVRPAPAARPAPSAAPVRREVTCMAKKKGTCGVGASHGAAWGV